MHTYPDEVPAKLYEERSDLLESIGRLRLYLDFETYLLSQLSHRISSYNLSETGKCKCWSCTVDKVNGWNNG